MEGPFVVYLIGVRLNGWWKPWVVFPFMATMPRMLSELGARHEGGQGGGPIGEKVHWHWSSPCYAGAKPSLARA